MEVVCTTCPQHSVRLRYAAFYQFRDAASSCYNYDYASMDLVACEANHPALYDLVRHSDSCGTWTPDECTRLLPLMRELVEHTIMKEDGPRVKVWKLGGGGMMTVTEYPATRTFASIAVDFVRLMEHCIKLKHTVEFR